MITRSDINRDLVYVVISITIGTSASRCTTRRKMFSRKDAKEMNIEQEY